MFKNAVLWYFRQAHFILFVLKSKEILLTKIREDNSYNLTMGQSKFSHELTFWFISNENGGKHKSKNTLRVEINKFCDGKRDPMRSFFAIDKM